jgi:hypothetical protein
MQCEAASMGFANFKYIVVDNENEVRRSSADAPKASGSNANGARGERHTM